MVSEEGSEFKIYTIEPASAPATGKHAGNPNKNRVLIVLTDETAFPKSEYISLNILSSVDNFFQQLSSVQYREGIYPDLHQNCLTL